MDSDIHPFPVKVGFVHHLISSTTTLVTSYGSLERGREVREKNVCVFFCIFCVIFCVNLQANHDACAKFLRSFGEFVELKSFSLIIL